MRVKLSPGQPYWMLLDPLTNQPKYYLSFEKPGPIDIPEEQLSKAELEALKRALYFRLLQTADGKQPQSQETPAADKIDAAYLVAFEPALKAQEYLQLNAKQCLEALPGLVQDSQLAILEAMRSQEEAGQNANGAPRKTVLAAIDKAIASCAGLTEITDSDPEEVTLSFDTPAEEGVSSPA